ncbi:MAG TPA: UvrD-helicase domain-containing protein [Kofleriaceae bacterium]|nr:UvrD-helicase domain-containing protein [Kofleriaceae bacterium]
MRPDSLPPASDRLVVVEASAGTGKTFFLEHRVVDLVLAGAELSQILLVTFTDKAVAELRMRIRDLLDRMARADIDQVAPSTWNIDDEARARLRAAVTAFDHAPIFTIHAFCHRILIEDAFAARRLFDQTQVADEVAFDTAFNALLRERFATHSPDKELLAAYLEWGKTVDNLRDLLLKCARADARPRRSLDPQRAVEVLGQLRAMLGTADERERFLHTTSWGRGQRYAADWVDEAGRVLDRARGDDPAVALAACDELRDVAEKIVKYAKGPVANTLIESMKVMSLGEAIASELLPHVVKRIGTDKAEHGMFDYDDMLDLVREALHGPRGSELATRLRTRMPWVMIDEFQDTDPVQWDIFRTVWMHPDAKGLTIVGDPKQAIYGFRGADVATYLDAKHELLRNGATQVDLDVNRRSTAELVEAVNALLAGPPLGPLMDKTITYDHPVKASGDVTCEGSRPPLTIFSLEGGGSRERDPDRDALALAISSEIERLRDRPHAWQSRGKAPPFTLGHCMVLTRTGKESLQIASVLRSRGLACALVESDKLFETREAAELAALLEAIAAPRDRSARMRALHTRFFDVPWAELMRVVDASDHHPLIARLFDWAALAGRREYEQLFRRVIEDSHFAERALVLGGGERALVNTWHLIELLLEEVARSRCDLHELTLRLRRWINEHEELADDRDVQRAETDADAIRILTIHKAKGLEAPYVFLFGCATGGPKSKVGVLRDGAGRTLHVDTNDDAIKQQLEMEADAENQRLAYVALTRAQIRLYVPLYGGKPPDKTAMYVPVQRCATHLLKINHPLVETVHVGVGVAPDPQAPADALATFDVPAPPTITPLAPLAPARLGLAMLSYTRLAHDLEAAALEPGELPHAIDPAEFDVDDRNAEARASLGPDDLPPGADAGLLLHAIFEHADLATARAAKDVDAWRANPVVERLLVDQAREHGIAEQCLPHAARIVHTTLTRQLALTDGTELPPLVEATAIARELEFTYPMPSAPDAPPNAPPRGLVKGFIDAIVAWNDELWVLDYKSDLLGGDDLASAATDRMHEKYGVQARLYAVAADRMRGNRRLAGLLFAFVRHDIVVPLRITDEILAHWTGWLASLRTEVPR